MPENIYGNFKFLKPACLVRSRRNLAYLLCNFNHVPHMFPLGGNRNLFILFWAKCIGPNLQSSGCGQVSEAGSIFLFNSASGRS